jgi:nucleotide-binding universal stress UspA family protein
LESTKNAYQSPVLRSIARREELTMYTRVTVGLDGSKLAEAALVPAAAVARAHGATVRIVSVATRHRDADALHGYHQALHDDGVLSTDSVTEVLPIASKGTARALCETAAGRDELLCLATRGQSGVGHLLFGGVAEGVLAHHAEPVLMVGPGFHADEPVTFRTLLLCLDGSEQSEAMIPHAAAWAEALRMSIKILHVAAPPATPDAEIPPGHECDAEDRRAEANRATAAYLESVAATLAFDGVHATWRIVESNNPARAICQVARAQPGTVVALATRGNGGLSLLTLGSVAMRVAHDSPVPVLVVRAGAARDKVPAGVSHSREVV